MYNLLFYHKLHHLSRFIGRRRINGTKKRFNNKYELCVIFVHRLNNRIAQFHIISKKMIHPLTIIQKYYRTDTELYHILIKHSEQVRDKALEVSLHHPELSLNNEFINEAAMLHDIGIFLCDAPRIHCHGTHQYIEHGYLGADLLRKEGLQEHALVCERHTGTGISLEQIISKNLPLPQRDMKPQSLEEKVICYADKFFSKTDLNGTLSIDRIRTMLGHHHPDNIIIFDEWHQLFS